MSAIITSLALLSIILLASAKSVMTGQYTCANGGLYTLCNNQWGAKYGKGSQNATLLVAPRNSIEWTTTYNWTGSADQVKSFTNVGLDSGSGIQLSAISSAPSIWNWQYVKRSSNLVADVSYDVFTGNASSGKPASSATSYEIMVWLSSAGGAQPIGDQIASGKSLSGYSWNLWEGSNSTWTIYSFVTNQGDIKNFNGDLNPFFQYLVQHQNVSSSQYIQAIQAGTEPFVGYATLLSTNFTLAFDTY